MTLYSSDKNAETDDGFYLFLELPASDPLFERKKKLLQINGFDPDERVHVRRTTCPNWMHVNLEKLLQRARIIYMDETELYFDGDDGSPVEYYSPRNEIEALNSILSLIDSSISSNIHKELDILQELRAATVGMIRDFGDKSKMEAKIVENCSCEKEKCLVRWGENNGVETKLQIAYFEGAGRGAMAIEELNVGDVALEIPVSILISEELVHKSNMFRILENIGGTSSETMLLLWSMREKHNHSSKFKMYFDTLPDVFNTGPQVHLRKKPEFLPGNPGV